MEVDVHGEDVDFSVWDLEFGAADVVDEFVLVWVADVVAAGVSWILLSVGLVSW